MQWCSRQGREGRLKIAPLPTGFPASASVRALSMLSENSSPMYSTARHSTGFRAAMSREKNLTLGCRGYPFLRQSLGGVVAATVGTYLSSTSEAYQIVSGCDTTAQP